MDNFIIISRKDDNGHIHYCIADKNKTVRYTSWCYIREKLTKYLLNSPIPLEVG